MAPNMVTTREGYFRWTDIVFEWAKLVKNPYQRRAVTSLVHQEALGRAEHPLAGPKRPLQVYICELKDDGCRLVCFSLAQVQYIQHYIDAMGIADPSHPSNVAHPPDVPWEGPIGTHVPLPSEFIPSEAFKRVTPVNFSKQTIKTLLKEMKKHNSAVRRERDTVPVFNPPEDAPKDLPTKPAAFDAPPAATPATPAISAPLETPDTSSERPQTNVSHDTHDNSPNAKVDWCDVASDDGPADTPVTDVTTPSEYFNRALAAVKFACEGGLAERLRVAFEHNKEVDRSKIDLVGVGRSLFISLAARIHPYNRTLVDFGFDAIWFESDLDTAGQFILQGMRGSWIAAEELGYSGEPTPYRHGKSKTIPRDAMKLNFQQMMQDLNARAGGGPIFFITHSLDEINGLAHLMGDNTVSGEFFHNNPPYDAYADHAACNAMFIMDTARLFAAVEQQQEGDASVQGVTGRSLINTMTVLHGPPPYEDRSDNAGDTATYTMSVFKRLLLDDNCPTLDDVRAKYAPKLAIPVAPKTDADADDGASDTSEIIQFEQYESGDDDDSDFEGIAVCIENADGELVPYNPDDDDE